MSQQQQLLKKLELTVSQILRVYGKQFTQITGWYTDGRNGRCAAGVLMSYYGWNGCDFFDIARSLICTLYLLNNAGVKIDFIAQLNDSGKTFDEIADFLEKVGKELPTHTSGLVRQV
ncbi:MAG: hypothetical protein ACRD8Z_03435 [Nitrososphaeraceae archaeon]